MPSMLHERTELRDGHLVAAHVERGEIDRSRAAAVPPHLVVEREGIARPVTPHEKRPRGNLDEAKELLVGQGPGIRSERH